MKRQDETKTAGRRAFLTLSGVGTVAAVAASAVGAPKAEAATGADVQERGYRETAHVRKVYELARF